jgi:imidazolonepropionase-like amidohydrolase
VIRRHVKGRGLWLAAALFLCASSATRPTIHAQGPSGTIVAVRGATILTVTKGTIANGTIIARDGKIIAVGTNLTIPAGAEVLDGTGKFVSPGIIDAHSHIAVDGNVNEGGTTVSSMVSIDDVLDPADIDIYRDLAGGTTTANVLHGSANPIGGTNAVIKLRWGKTRPSDLLFEGAMPGVKFALGENPKDMRQFGQTGPRRFPVTRMGVEYVIRDAFTRARAYQAAWKDYERRKAAGADVVPPARDLQLEPLVEVLEGKRLVHAHCYRADEILMLIRVADEMGFKVATFQHVLEGYKVAREIASHGAGASTFSDWWGYKIEADDAIPYNAALMTRKGVLVSVNSDSAEHARRLNTEAAKAMHWGDLTEDEALALVTINPARQLRIDNRVGSLEIGKDADFVVWNHHPLSSYAIVDRAYIDGTLYYDRQADEKRLTALQKEKTELARRLRDAEGAETPRRAGAPRGDQAPTGDQAPKNTETQATGWNGVSDSDAATTQDHRGGNGGGPGAEERATPVQSGGSAAAQTSAGTEAWAITNARIHPVTSPEIERGTILIRGSRIEAVGANVTVPPGTKTVDAAGADVYPGWINARTTLGLAEPGARGYDDVTEMLDFNPQLRTVVAFHSDSEAIPVARANGVTTVAVFPSGGILGGEVAVMDLDGWTWEDNAVRPNAGISFQFPTIGRAGGFGGFFGQQEQRPYEELKKERDEKLDKLARLFDDARAYAKAAKGSRSTDLVLEALVPVVEKRLPLFTAASREQEIRDAVAFADRVGVNIVITGGQEAALVAPLLKEHGIPVILGPVLTLPTREDMFHASTYQLAGELVAAGVKVAFATGDNTNVRQVPYNAAESVAWGMSRDDAIRALTINAAEILGVADRLGSIEPGKQANLLIARGDPLEVRTPIGAVVIDGRSVDLGNKQLALYERYRGRQ